MGACSGCGTLVLVIVNLLFSLVGLALLVIGCLVRFGSDVFDEYLKAGYAEFNKAIQEAANTHDIDITGLDVGDIVGDSTIAFIVVGVFFFVLGIFGCVGAVCKVKVLLTVYAIVLLVIFLVELIFVILLLAMKSTINDWIKKPLISTLEEEYTGTNGTDIFTLTINFVMHEMECCGISNYSDFSQSAHWGFNQTWKKIPYICCKNTTFDVSRECVANPTVNNSYIGQGCFDAVNDWLTERQHILIAVGAVTAAVQLLLIIFTFVICCQERRKGDKDEDKNNEEMTIDPYREPKGMHGQQNMGYEDFQDGRGYHHPPPYQGRTDPYSGPPEGYGRRDYRR